MAARFPIASATAQASSVVPRVPPTYVLPPPQRPTPGLNMPANLPIINLAALHNPFLRAHAIREVTKACKELGIFQVINHGIPSEILKSALDAAAEFFDLPIEEKMLLWSENVHEPIRYGTSLNHAKEKFHYWRDFIKHYCNPIHKWIDLWPSNPPCYRRSVGRYSEAVQVLQKQLIEAVLESLGLEKSYLESEMDEGCQVMAVNSYPACPEPEMVLGMPAHSDFGSLTILLQSCEGLQILNHNSWLSVPATEGALTVLMGDQLEVMSNGIYKSVVHRVTVSKERKRLSIASLHSLPMDRKVEPAPTLVSDNKAGYRNFSFKEFLDYISSNDIAKGRFIDTLKMT